MLDIGFVEITLLLESRPGQMGCGKTTYKMTTVFWGSDRGGLNQGTSGEDAEGRHSEDTLR